MATEKYIMSLVSHPHQSVGRRFRAEHVSRSCDGTDRADEVVSYPHQSSGLEGARREERSLMSS